MIGNIVKVYRIHLSKVLHQSERWLSCQLCARSNLFVQRKSFHYTCINKPLLLPSVTTYDMKRQYSIGEYDKLWQAVSSGRGQGRGGKKKVPPKDLSGEFLKFGSSNMSWPGLNAALPGSEWKDKDTSNLERPKRTFEKGWTGKSWPGRHAGPPVTLNGDIAEGFDSIVIEVKRISATKASGRHRTVSAIVVVGNKQGAIGWAIGKGTYVGSAVRKARNKAINYLHYVPICDGHTIYHNLQTKVKSTKILFERKVPGYGRRSQRIICSVCELAGIEDIRCKLVGRSTPLTVIRCVFQGLMMQETHQELADRMGKHVVEYRAEQGNRPIVVASPSLHAINRRLEKESKSEVEDITAAFDPYHGAHRPKSLVDIEGEHPDVLADMQQHEVKSF